MILSNPQRGLGRPLGRWRYQCNFPAPSWAPTSRNALCHFESDWFNLYDLRPIMCGSLSTLLHAVLASSFPLWQDFSKRASFPIACAECFYKKVVWGVVKSWEFEGNLRCSKILRIRRKNPMKWVLSISRDYCVYLDITLQSFKIWEFWGEFWGIETFYRSKFSPATGVRTGFAWMSKIGHFQTFKVWTFVPAIFWFLIVCVVKMSDRKKK